MRKIFTNSTMIKKILETIDFLERERERERERESLPAFGRREFTNEKSLCYNLLCNKHPFLFFTFTKPLLYCIGLFIFGEGGTFL